MSQPQTHDVSKTELLFRVNAAWVNGVAPGYWPTAGAGLTLNLSAGTANCPAGTIASYAGGTLTMDDNTSNYVYLDATGTPAFNTTGFTATLVPIAIVVTSGGAITGITDVRTSFFTGGGGGGVPTARLISTTLPLTGGGDLTADRTLDVNNFGGDAGAGGTKGTVPAPGVGDNAAGKYLKAGGGWDVPPGTGVPTGRTISTTLPLTGGGDLSGNRILDINDFGGDAGAGGTKGTVPAPVAGDTAAGKFLKASGGWAVPAGGGGGGVNSQAGDYTTDSTDNGKLVVMTKATAKTLTLPVSPPSATWAIFVGNSGAGELTVARNGLTIDGAATDLTLQQYQGVVIYTDGSNYFTERGQPNFGTQTANWFLAGPSSGAVAVPAFRAITSADLPIGVRADVALDAGTIAAGAGATGSVALGKSSLLYLIVAAYKCRLRLYSTAASRDDAGEVARAWGVIPGQNIDLLLDITWGGVAPQTYPINPKAVLENKDGSVTTAIYYNVTSREVASRDFTFTLTRLLLEN